MKKRTSLIFLFVLAFKSLLAQSHVDLSVSKQSIDQVIRWKGKGLVVLGRNRSETTLYFVNSSGMPGWKHSIANDTYQYGRAKTAMAANSRFMYYVAYVNDKMTSRLYLFIADEDGKFTAKTKDFDHYRILSVKITEDGAVVFMKDNARNDMDRQNRLVTFGDETGEPSVSTDIELPQGRWSPEDVFQNALVLKGNDGRISDAARSDTFCFLDATGKLLDRIVLEVKLPEGSEITYYPRYFFDDEGQAIYCYYSAKDKKDSWNSRFCVNKYDHTGKLLFSVNKRFDELSAFNELLAKKSMYNEPVYIFFFVSQAWGGCSFVFEKQKGGKTTEIVMNTAGEIKQVISEDHYYLKEKYFNMLTWPDSPRSEEISLNLFTTLFVTKANRSLLDHAGPLDKAAKLTMNDPKTRAYYNVERIGEKNLILEYFPGDAMLQIYSAD